MMLIDASSLSKEALIWKDNFLASSLEITDYQFVLHEL